MRTSGNFIIRRWQNFIRDRQHGFKTVARDVRAEILAEASRRIIAAMPKLAEFHAAIVKYRNSFVWRIARPSPNAAAYREIHRGVAHRRG
jgi:hypothetical protein